MFTSNREKYFNQIKEKSLSLFFSGKMINKTADQYYPFHVNHNFYYLTGINQDDVVLLMAKSNSKEDTYLFIHKPDPLKALWDGATLSFEQASEISGIPLKNILDRSDFDSFFNRLTNLSRNNQYGDLETIYLDLARNDINDQTTQAFEFSRIVNTRYPHLTILRSTPFLYKQRMVKSDYEISKIKEAVRITEEGLTNLYTKLSKLTNENHALAEFRYVLNYNGADEGFDTIVANDKNATILHYIDNNSDFINNSMLLIDCGARKDMYSADVSRTYPVNGVFTNQQRVLYQAVLNVNKKVIKWLKAGITLKEFNDYGRELLIEEARKLDLIKEDSEISKYYYHSLGHYLGLDIHDVGDATIPIPEGSVITVEPGLYVEEWNMGVRIEDNILVTKNGNINLTESIIKEINDIESEMKKLGKN